MFSLSLSIPCLFSIVYLILLSLFSIFISTLHRMPRSLLKQLVDSPPAPSRPTISCYPVKPHFNQPYYVYPPHSLTPHIYPSNPSHLSIYPSIYACVRVPKMQRRASTAVSFLPLPPPPPPHPRLHVAVARETPFLSACTTVMPPVASWLVCFLVVVFCECFVWFVTCLVLY